ncbi:MAG: 5-carboxymethyl-2-hydroxymuconate isomerase [Polaromonas sp.]|nr:5-carboxymethyl-2-hydroxymuconate isomerase [Polaromonas sp.]
MIQRAGDAVLASTKAHLEHVFSHHAIGLTLQIIEGAPVYEGKSNNLAGYLV